MTTRGDVTVGKLPEAFDGWAALLDLIRGSFAYMDGVIDPPSSMHLLDVSTLAEKCARETVFIALDGERIVGCVFLAHRGGHAYVGKLAVAPDRQGRGIGGMLMRAAEEEVRRLGLSRIVLQSRIELTANHAAFARFGFVESERTAHAGYDRPTSLTMTKDLA